MLEVEKNFYRGPRPTSFEELDKNGINVVINLQSGIYEKVHNDAYENENAVDWDMCEYEAPLSDIFPPSFDKTKKIYNTIRRHRESGQSVYIHCLHGKDRTGFNVAYYRVVKNRWSFSRAVAEMFSLGFHKWPYILWVPFLWAYCMISSIQTHHSQDLRDNKLDRERYVFNKRGWFPSWRWQFLISRNPFKLYHILSFNIKLTKNNKSLEGFNLGFFGIQLYITFTKHDDTDGLNYGFYFDDEAVVFRWAKEDWDDGGFIKFVYYPWSYDHCEIEFINKEGVFVRELKGDWKVCNAYKEANQKEEVYPYKYTLRSGEIQERTATVTANRYTHWQRWFGLGKYKLSPKRVRTSIWITFSDEVGEATGSWKGGTTGCGYGLLPKETMEQCLRRMERERRFD